MNLRTLLLAAALPLLAGCDIVETDFDEQVLPGVLEMDVSTPAQVELPTSVRVGDRFTVRVTTYGGGCTRKGDTQVSVSGSQVEVRPYDFHPRAGEDAGCTRDIRMHLHEASVWLEQPGPATVIVHGRRMPADETVTVTRTLTVTAG